MQITGTQNIGWTAKITPETIAALVLALEGCLYVLDESIDGRGPSPAGAINEARAALRRIGSPLAEYPVAEDIGS
jgi:hypothetical protein